MGRNCGISGCGMRYGLFNPFFSGNYNGSTSSGDWILETGYWDDEGIWKDGSNWTELSYNSNYQIILAQANSEGISLPSESQLTKDSDFLTAIESLWSKIKGMKMFKSDGTRVSNFARIDWKTPASYRATLVNNPSYDSNGYYSNGTNSYVDSGIPISITNQQGFSIFAKGINNAGTGSSFLFGASNVNPGASGSTFVNPRNATDNFSFQSASTTLQSVGSTTDARNRICIGRTSGNHFYSINGAAKVSSSNTYSPIAPTSKTFYLLADNGLSVSGYNTRGISYFIVAEDLSDSDIAILDAALQNWLS